MIFKQGGEIAGVEADFARRLGEALNRRTVFVEVPWDKQIDYLEQNRTDIIMSNMTITAPRSVRVSFSTPYMQSGLTGLFRRNNYDPNGLVASTIRLQNQRIGFVNNTTGEFFCRQRFTRATLRGYPDTQAAVTALCYPLAVVLSAALFGVRSTAPGVMIEDDGGQIVNAVLAQWRRDGTIIKVIQQWIPSFQQ